MNPPTREQLLNVFSYNKETGEFTRILRTSKSIPVGHSPSGKNSDGYVSFRVNGSTHKAHRLAWLAITGEWPNG